MIEAVSSGLEDVFPWCRKNRVKFLGMLCVLQFLLAIPMIMQSGIYWVTLLDWYSSGLPLMVAGGCEIIVIGWVYGVDRFLYDLQCMIGYRPSTAPLWRAAWKFITPVLIMGLVLNYFVFNSPVRYNGIAFPTWAEVIGWMTLLISIICIPITALYQLKYHPRAKGTFFERVAAISKCDPDWGPQDKSIPYKYRDGNFAKELELIPMSADSGKHGHDAVQSSGCCLDGGETNSDTSSPPAYEYE